MANKKTFNVTNDEIAVRTHNEIMSMYASDEQLAALRDRIVRPATDDDIRYFRERRCKLY